MPGKLYVIDVKPEDVVELHSATDGLSVRKPLTRADVKVTGYRGTEKPNPTDVVRLPPSTEPPPTEPPPPPTEPPPPSGGNQLPGLTGADCVTKAVQSPAYFNIHAPRPELPGVYLVQADTSDPFAPSPWPSQFPSSAWIQVETAFGLPAHSSVQLKWPVAHHMELGRGDWRLEGRNDPGAAYDVIVADQVSITAGTPGDKRIRFPSPFTIAVSGGGFKQYRVRATVTLGKEGDAMIFGWPELTLA